MNLWIPPFLTKAPFGSILSARIGQAVFGQAREGVRNGFCGGKCGACLKNSCFIGLQVLALYVSHSTFATTKVIFGWPRQYAPADPAKVSSRRCMTNRTRTQRLDRVGPWYDY